MTAYIEGVGVVGPGFENWPAARAVLAGDAAYAYRPTALSPPAELPPAERRRVGESIKLALATGIEAVRQAGIDPGVLPTVFSSSSADGFNCHMICEALAGDRLISPTRFTNSVQNAPAGYWSIAHRSMAPSTSVCGLDGSFAGGLLEAVGQVLANRAPVALIASDTPYPEPLRSARSGEDAMADAMADAMGIALVLAPAPTPRSLARIDLEMTRDEPTMLADLLPDSELDSLRLSMPAARGLPLLWALAQPLGNGGDYRVVIEYLNHRRIAVSVGPCAPTP